MPGATSTSQLVILAGGLGTRARVLTNDTIPKALVPVLGKPFVDWQLAWALKQGINSVVFCVGHKAGQLTDHVARTWTGQLDIQFSDDGEQLLGTGGALKLACDRGLLRDQFFTLYGDSYLPIDYGAVQKFAGSTGAEVVMTIYENLNALEASNIVRRDDQTICYDKSRSRLPIADYRFIDYGLIHYQRRVVEKEFLPTKPFGLDIPLFQLSEQRRVFGFQVEQRFYEIGSKAGFDDLEQFLKGQNS